MNVLGRNEDAIIDYTKAIEIAPLFAGAYINRGRCRFQYFLGYAFKELGRNEDAISDYTKAIEIEPRASHAYRGRGSY